MQRWGVTGIGKLRFRCSGCAVSRIRRRPDHADRQWKRAFLEWAIGGGSLLDIARRQRVGLSTVQRHFRACWATVPQPTIPADPVPVIILDGTGAVKHRRVALVAQDSGRRQPVTWAFAERESFDSWWRLLNALQTAGVTPRFVVCDGQKGLLKALRSVWPQVVIQRCLLHVVRQARLWLTQHPKTPAGQDLLVLVRALSSIRTKRQRRRWLRAYRTTPRHIARPENHSHCVVSGQPTTARKTNTK